MNILFFAVFVLFTLLILRLGIVQIVNGNDYLKEVERTENVKANNGSPPRGKIYDRYRNVIVDNIPMNAITYTRTQSTKPDEMLKVARKLAELIKMNTEKITDRDRQDYWLLTHPEEAEKLVSKEEIKRLEDNKDLTKDEVNKNIYQMQLDRITEENIQSFNKAELEVLAIFREFNTGYALSPQIIKNEGVTTEEMARVSENLAKMPGVNVTTDWKRTYAVGDTLRSILGKVSSSKEGLPSELVNSYTAKGYALNDRVGTSYVESQYEDVLKGQKEEIEYITKKGSVLEEQLVKEGHSGKDVVLTIDMKLQKEVEKIVEEELGKQAAKRWQSPFLDRAFVIMIDPNTGEILSMVGKKYGVNSEGSTELQDYALGTFTSAYEAGSAVKGATVLTGYMTDKLQIGDVILDEVIKIKDTPPKRSWFNLARGSIYLNDLQALEMSSNAYMFKIALRIANAHYVREQPLDYDVKAFDVLRNHFSQFGLGVKTGLDLPGEVDGFKGTELIPGKLMDLAIGQYDLYTPMQLAQYVSAVANGGYRVEPHIMKEIREPNHEQDKIGPILLENQTKVLNKIDVTERELQQVQRGFYRVAHGSQGTAREFANAPYDAAAKSGTAETYYNKVKVYNTTLIGYAPYNNPEIAFSVVLPWSHIDKDPYVNKIIAKRVMDKYFELKKEAEEKGLLDTSIEGEVRTMDNEDVETNEATE
ncbi:penicillin-binding protein 2 [Bacillus sp. V3]|uniref:peptidoglycan D,D-transpeptidase FtsI family protein n=1 Tax=[Bacillus] enclensis TaxID=1402860 RepID=UPI0018D2FF71|nr:penicillin-binding protein 2 [[Bacillus] enclensis]MBH9965183.1 penicillin-binding protein 2 [[Bacillus] enclensis]QTC42661.1 penicillin-binding protein 2 [Bacillus sp. V3]